jgi:hypothetical protein
VGCVPAQAASHVEASLTVVEFVSLVINGGILLGGGAGGAVYGFRRMAASKRKNSSPPPKFPSMSPDSPSPAALEHERMKAAARAAGYGPGRTGEFGRMNSLGEMRCSGHQEVLNVATQAKDMAIAVQGAASAAASAASAATAAAVRLEEVVRSESATTHEKLDAISDRLTESARNEGATDARLNSIERDVGRLLTRGTRS